MVSHFSGIPLRLCLNGNTYGEFSTFLPGITNLGDILNKEGYNQKFILGQEEFDFLLDGYSIRKMSYLKKVKIQDDKCNEISKELGITAQVQNPEIDISSWENIFHSLKALNDIIIIEDEINEKFAIGIVQKVLKNKLYFLEFDANGVWNDCQLEIPYSTITSVKWNTRYITAWKKYLKLK